MRDDAWWDGEDDERIAALQAVLSPLRERARPWGDVYARAHFDVRSRRSPARVRALAATLAAAAALALGWWWGRGDAQPAALAPVVEPLSVAEPPPPEPRPTATLIVPMPVIVVANDEAVAEPANPEVLGEQLRNPVEQDNARAAARARPRRDEAAADVEAVVEDIPEQLTTSDVKAGIAPHRAAARACGPRHGAKPGVTVIIKLSIAGATGKVTSSVAQSPHGGTELGRCVADALGRARFPRFQRASMGVMYPVKL